MAHDEAKLREAKRLYIADQQTLPAIEILLKVKLSTLRRWKTNAREDGDDWDSLKNANLIAKQGMDKYGYSIFEMQNEASLNALMQVKNDDTIPYAEKIKFYNSLQDTHIKNARAASILMPKLSKLGVAIDVLQRLADFAQAQFPQEANSLLVVLEPFSKELARAYQ